MRQGIKRAFALALSALLLVGCQETSDTPADSGTSESAETAAETPAAEGTTPLSVHDGFTSTDGSVLFTIEYDGEISAADIPLVRVTPHFLTAEDAERVAYTLFPDGEFYEAEPITAYSGGELQQLIQYWSQYATADSLRELLGEGYIDNYYEAGAETVNRYIAQYTALVETASEESTRTLCRWVFQKLSAYQYTEAELATLASSDCNDGICARITVDGIPYYYCVSTRNESDYKVNQISVYVDGDGPANMENAVFRAQKCAEEPTEEQITAAKEKAESYLSAFSLGQWQADECYVQTYDADGRTEYYICVNALPVVGGAAAMHRQQLSSLRDENGCFVGQYYTEASFRFAADGTLWKMSLSTPLETESVIKENAQTLTTEQLLENAKQLLLQSDATDYYGAYALSGDEDTPRNVFITDIRMGLARVLRANDDNSYDYVPALLLEGADEYMAINAVDGTQISS